MTKFDEPYEFNGYERIEALLPQLSRFTKRVYQLMNGRLDFGDNLRAAGPYTVSLAPAVDTTFSHNLGAVPNGYLVISQNAAGSVIAGNTAWSLNTMSLRASATLTAKVWVV